MHETQMASQPVTDDSSIYQTVFAQSTVGKLLIQRKDTNTFKVINANAAAARYGRWEGFDHNDIVGKNMLDVFDGLVESGLVDKYNEALDSNTSVSLGELVYGDTNVPDGVFKVDLVPLGEEKLLIAFENITEMKLSERRIKQANENLRRLNRELDAFAYVASHDLRSPLRGIDNLAQWVIEDIGDEIPDTSKRHLKLMHERVRRLERLLDDLLHYSRAGRYEYESEQVDTYEMVQEIVGLLRNDSELEFRIDPNLPAFETVKPPFQQVLQNLINNAIKYHDKKDGFVEVGWNDVGAFYQFWVADNGPGIDPEFHKKIFQMFQKLQSRDEVEGTGIGLAVVKKTIEGYGGKIKLTSKIGQGARFEFSWPKSI